MNLKKEFKMTKREKILTIILAGILLGYGWYQVAYGTNERDYKYGYKNGLGEYQQCRTQNICAMTENTFTVACEHYNGPNFGSTPTYNVDNEIACQHGYFHGWIHECLNDGGGAMCTALFSLINQGLGRDVQAHISLYMASASY